MNTKTKMPINNYPARELTEDTKWIICMWDIRGDAPEETAIMLQRSLKQVTDIIDECKADGYYDKVKRHIEEFDLACQTRKEKTASMGKFRLPLTCLSTRDGKVHQVV